ncbi:MAG: hypothetical protein HC765_06110 [Brachymonas sp.]|nr:hypothetical protein [Brachymonas sp.]
MPASAQNRFKIEVQANTNSPCPAIADLQNTDLFGAWSLLLEGGGQSVVTRMQLQRNPEFAESLAGSFSLENKTFEVFGDIEAGAFDLEESANGKDISAIWKGRVVEGSCGQTILGTRRNVADNKEQSFVMRRPGW